MVPITFILKSSKKKNTMQLFIDTWLINDFTLFSTKLVQYESNHGINNIWKTTYINANKQGKSVLYSTLTAPVLSEI